MKFIWDICKGGWQFLHFYINKRRLLSDNTVVGSILIAAFSILAQYELPIMSYGLVFLIIYGCYAVVIKGVHIYINKGMMWFISYALLQQILIYMFSGTFSGGNVNTYLFMIISLFILCTVCHVEKEQFVKIYYIVGVICSVAVIYQFIMANVFNVPQSSIQFLPVAEVNQHFWISNSNRVSGLFTEPQGFCSYILPLLAILVFGRKFKSALFISVAIFASTSSQGIILLVFIWGCYFLFDGKDTVNKYIRLMLISILAILLLVLLSRMTIFAFIFDKIREINIFGYDIRLTKGFQIFCAMPVLDKITGIGFGNLELYLRSGNFNFFWMELTRPELFAYITTMSNIFVSFGIFGAFFYLNVFRRNIVNCSAVSKIILLLIFISSFTQTILFNAWFIFYWLVFEIFDEKNALKYYVIRQKRNRRLFNAENRDYYNVTCS